MTRLEPPLICVTCGAIGAVTSVTCGVALGSTVACGVLPGTVVGCSLTCGASSGFAVGCPLTCGTSSGFTVGCPLTCGASSGFTVGCPLTCGVSSGTAPGSSVIWGLDAGSNSVCDVALDPTTEDASSAEICMLFAAYVPLTINAADNTNDSNLFINSIFLFSFRMKMLKTL